MSVKEMVLQELQSLSEEKLQKVAEFVAFLRFQERVGLSSVDPEQNSEVRLVELTDKEKEQYLEELLAGITEENLHPEIKTGPSVGNEAW